MFPQLTRHNSLSTSIVLHRLVQQLPEVIDVRLQLNTEPVNVYQRRVRKSRKILVQATKAHQGLSLLHCRKSRLQSWRERGGGGSEKRYRWCCMKLPRALSFSDSVCRGRKKSVKIPSPPSGPASSPGINNQQRSFCSALTRFSVDSLSVW